MLPSNGANNAISASVTAAAGRTIRPQNDFCGSAAARARRLLNDLISRIQRRDAPRSVATASQHASRDHRRRCQLTPDALCVGSEEAKQVNEPRRRTLSPGETLSIASRKHGEHELQPAP